MQNENELPFASIFVCSGITPNSQLGVTILLSASAMTTDLNGDPCPGLFLDTSLARRVAYQILGIAEEQDAKMRARS